MIDECNISDMEITALGKNSERLVLCKTLEKELKYSRFIHTLGVAFTAASLAARYNEDTAKAEKAGLLHDCAKYMDVKKMEKVCAKAGLAVSDIEKGNAALLHSKAGSIIARTKYNVEDEDILNAIKYHTTGRPDMSVLEKILFIADYIEPGRNEAPHLEELRKLAFEDLDEALIMILKDTLDYLNTTSKEIDLMTQMTYNYYVSSK